ncbi:hypothetical protein SKAU_G00027930 [Synaphobranchus kaupii]|uniref:Uncharacterized protein n=1 Tax=Synaphobranchus kaupii TaxID=118154 RepID=A0A9Q1GEE6_SYNKA|nr:hypothetical protein SKAU_G00027930 [Synaphobranchus kaupii]
MNHNRSDCVQEQKKMAAAVRGLFGLTVALLPGGIHLGNAQLPICSTSPKMLPWQPGSVQSFPPDAAVGPPDFMFHVKPQPERGQRTKITLDRNAGKEEEMAKPSSGTIF